MNRPILLWTERPKLLERELETHEWMMREKPWERFGLELVYDNAPGGWPRYFDVFARTAMRAQEEGRLFLNVESDILPTVAAFQALLSCSQAVCLVPYRWTLENWWGAWVEERARGGWRTRTAEPGDEWCQQGDLGMVRISPGAIRGDLRAVTKKYGASDVSWLHAVYGATGRRVHLHWPGLRNNHIRFDEGDREHTNPTLK